MIAPPNGPLALRVPALGEQAEFLRAHHSTTPDVPHFLHYYEEGMEFGRYLQILDEQHRGVNVRADQVPSTFLFAFDNDRIVGRVSIRHALNEFLLRFAGHI